MVRRMEHINAARDEALRLGAVLVVEPGTKHIKGTIYYNGEHRKTSFSISPSRLACHQTRMYIRKAVREMEQCSSSQQS